jgi:hypothetical protein
MDYDGDLSIIILSLNNSIIISLYEKSIILERNYRFSIWSLSIW